MPWGTRVSWGTKKKLHTSTILNQAEHQLENAPSDLRGWLLSDFVTGDHLGSRIGCIKVAFGDRRDEAVFIS